MKRALHFLLLVGVVFGPALLRAQDDNEKPVELGQFSTHGSATVGYRFADVKGFEPMYNEVINLQSGPRLLDFNIFGDTKEGSGSFADNYSVTMSGLGGDPFPTAQLSVNKHRLFDFRASWRQAYYNWNQNDSVILPIASFGKNLSTGLTDHHDWETVRKFGTADLTLHASNNLRFNFDYYRTTDTGSTFTTAAPDFLGSPGFWGSYARANPFFLFAPISDEMNRVTGGVDYTFHSWTVHYVAGYQSFTANTTLNNVSSPQLSINPAPSSLMQPLTTMSWSQSRRLTSPVSELSLLGKPRTHVELRGSYIFYRFQGPLNFDQSFNGTAPNSIGIESPYSVSQSVRGTASEPEHIASVGFTYDIRDWWSLSADYRYSHQTSNGFGSFNSLFNGSVPTTNSENIEWRNNLSDLDISMDFTPFGTMVIRPGIHLMKADVENLSGGVIDPVLTKTIKTVWPELSFGYEPSKTFSFRGDIRSVNNGTPYTAITPHTEVGGHAIVQFHPLARLSFDDELNVSNGRLVDTDYRNAIRANAITGSYALNERLSLFAGFTYDNFLAQGDIIYLRGTPPLNNFVRDQEINRVWQGGIQVKAAKRFEARLSGNYARSSGVGQITGEPPAYGPVTWPLITGTVSYEFPKAGCLSLDLQRTYYVEEIVRGNNFSGNLLTIRWTRSF